jgi:ATP-dependent DNA helicase RecQ
MPAAHWDTYRLGARIPSLDGLIGPDASDRVGRLQQALSAVAFIRGPSAPAEDRPATEDARFVGRLLLGLLCRGWPTFSSPAVEEALLESIDPAAHLVGRPMGPDGQIGWRLDDDGAALPGTWEDAIRRALLRGDHRLGIDEATVAMLTDSRAEQEFYRAHLAPLLGQAIGWLELQRPLASMVREDPDSERLGSGRVDFALDLPGTRKPVRRVIELDGPRHRTPSVRHSDDYRDQLLSNHGWQTNRVPIETLDDGSLNHLPGTLRAIIENNPFPFTDIEDGDQALENPRDREAARLILTPHAVARVQLALCRAVMDGALRLSAPEWTVAVVEREVPCAALAVHDWLQPLTHLRRLYGIPSELTRVRLLVATEHLAPFAVPTWKDLPEPGPRVVLEPFTTDGDVRRVDLGIDVSVGAHPTRRYPTDPLRQPELLVSRRVALRTAQRQSGYRVDPWPEPRAIAKPLDQQDSLVYFLKALFRKREFRPGQLPIVERVLRRDDVIGLLPTGAGKSVTFQLPALLSPGLTLVIDPIKSLMQDQADNLAALGVTDAIQINSDTGTKERERIEWQFGQGEYRLIFISPERLQIKDFRDRLAATANKRPIAHVVIDEAHCVSEWGHDFRTAYLNLGRIATDFCGRDGVRPPMVALTGTASESVLRDIQRELQVEADETIVRPSKFERDELKFEIVRVPKGQKASELARLIGTVIPEKLGVEPDVLASGACGGIVFCPHVNGGLGVATVADRVSRALSPFGKGGSPVANPDRSLVGFYSGEPPKTIELSDLAWAERKTRTQRAFKAGRKPLLVATSAFGMGIDKPDIRYTVHYAMAKSVEAFAQEAGRAGRDRRDAICAVLFTDRLAPSQDGITPAPLDCLELGISVEEAQARAAASQWDSDDAEMQMYLHTRSYQGVSRESAAIRAFYQTWIEPHLPGAAARNGQALEVTVGEQDFQHSIEALMAPLMPVEPADPENVSAAGANAKKDGLPTPELQRLIYRLSLLGIVGDYTVAYGHGNAVYTLSARAIDEGTVKDRLLGYVARYRSHERIRSVEDRIEASTLEDPVSRCIDTLCRFVYEEIEQRRRQGIENMRSMLRESSDGADFARRMNRMLSFTALTREVFDLLRSDDHHEWEKVAAEIVAAETAEYVYYQCRRALEDAPTHPGLRLLVALALQGSEGHRREEVVTNLRDGLRQVRQGFSRDDQQSIATWVVPELARIAPGAAPAVLDQVVRHERDPIFADAILRSVSDGTLASDPILVRTSRRSVLQSLDDRLHRFMTG